MNDPTQLSIYQFRAVLNGVSPTFFRFLGLPPQFYALRKLTDENDSDEILTQCE